MQRGLILFSLLLLFSCASDAYKEATFKASGNQLKTLTYDSNLRSVFIKDTNLKIKFCSEPAPDTGEGVENGVTAKESTPGVSEGISYLVK